MDSAEAGCKWKHKVAKKSFPYSNCIIIALPIVSFLSLGIYFILVDLKILASVLNSQPLNATNSTGSEVSRHATEASTPSTNATEDATVEERVLVILESDANRTKFVLEAQAEEAQEEEEEEEEEEVGVEQGLEEAEREDAWSSWKSSTTTTEKAFVYSPTVPHVARQEANRQTAETTATDEEESSSSSEGRNCFSTRLGFCEGFLPYDLVQLPNVLNITRYDELEWMLPHFGRLVNANCSSRARELVCSVLEPECRTDGSKQVFPCLSNCRAVADECKHVIFEDPALSVIFNCQEYPDWDASPECLDVFTGNCHEKEFECSTGGRCIPGAWVCDGSNDCGDYGSDEAECPSCPSGYFRCDADERCIPAEWVCDGRAHCSDTADEAYC